MRTNTETFEQIMKSKMKVALLSLALLELTDKQIDSILETIQEIAGIAFEAGTRVTMYEISKEVFGIDLDEVDLEKKDLDEDDVKEILGMNKTEASKMN